MPDSVNHIVKEIEDQVQGSLEIIYSLQEE